MVPQVRCKAPRLLRPLQTWSLTSLHSGQILHPENTRTIVFQQYPPYPDPIADFQRCSKADIAKAKRQVAVAPRAYLARSAKRRRCLALTSANLKARRRGECAEAVLMMRPHLRTFIPGTAARIV